MNRMIFLVDIDRCIRCHACEAACKQENDLPPGPRWCRVVTVEPREVKGEICTDFVFTTCAQCEDPSCARVCPPEALTKREDGIVTVDSVKCTGCGLCENACPFGAIHLNPVTKKAWKCNQCAARVEDGGLPSCVQHCAGGALQYVTSEEFLAVSAGRHTVRLGKVNYISSKWRLSVPRPIP